MKYFEEKQMIDFGLHFAAALDNINRHEGDTDTIQAVISTLLRELEYEKRDAYGASIALDFMLAPLGGVSGAYRLDNFAATLMSLLTTAIEIIEQKQIPNFILDKIDQLN